MSTLIDPLNDGFPQRMRDQLALPLPGAQAQRLAAPELAYGRHFGPPAYDSRSAAVVALLYPDRGKWTLPLTLRPDHMETHAGQISFPGGMDEQGELPEQCAARECEEELGVARDAMTFVGRLSPIYVFNSNFWVTPCIAVVRGRPRFQPNPAEVARVVEIELESLLDPNLWATHTVVKRGVRFLTRHFQCCHDRIWGATGMMLSELTAIVSGLCPPRS